MFPVRAANRAILPVLWRDPLLLRHADGAAGMGFEARIMNRPDRGMMLQKHGQGGGCPLLGLDAREQCAQSPKCQIDTVKMIGCRAMVQLRRSRI
jgi:hypothetical protein